MKETVKTSRTAGYLEKIFRALNQDSFGGELEEPIITIQDTPKTYGHVTVHKTWKRKEDWRHELNIGAATLHRPIEEVIATMLHEMVHLYNIQHNVQDCSRGGTYHNKKFAEEAEKHMLHVEQHPKYGWTITSPTEQLLDYIIARGWEDIHMTRNPLYSLLGPGGEKVKGNDPEGQEQTEKKKSSSRKYVCPKCGCIIRATKEVRVICADCDEMFELES